MSRARIFIVILLGVYSIATISPDLLHCFLPKAGFGYIGGKYSGVQVTAVEPGSPAAKAGIEAGDRIRTRLQTMHERLFVGTGRTLIPEMSNSSSGTVPYAGERVALHVVHAGTERVVTVAAQGHDPTSADIFWELWGFACHVLRVVLGAALVLARPGLVTWAFYAYMLGLGFFGSSDYYNVLPAPLWIALMTPQYVISHAAPASQALLWLSFPAGSIAGWRRAAMYIVIAGFAAGAAIALTLMLSAVVPFNTIPLESAWNVYDVAIGVPGMIALGETAFRSRGFDRRLIGLLFGITLLAFSAEATINIFGLLHMPPWAIFRYVFLLGILLPLFVGYAIVRYQLFDVEYVLGRVLFVAMLAVLVAGIFIGVDALFAAYSQGSRGELAVDFGLALALGFALQAFHKRALDLVDRLFFAQRYDVRLKMRAIFRSVSSAGSRHAIEKIVTSDAGAVLGLASAAFFASVEDGGFLRTSSYGWETARLWNVLPDEDLAEQLHNARDALNLRDLRGIVTGLSAPNDAVFAVPMRTGERVVGTVLYGDMLDGTSPSADEIRALSELVQSSAGRYVFFGRTAVAPAIRETASMRAAP